MTLDQIRSIVKRNTKADTMSMPNYSVNMLINLAQKEIVRQTLCLKKKVVVTTAAAQQEYDLPSDFHKSIQMKVASNRPEYKKEEYIDTLYTTTAATGTPYYYYVDREAGKYGLYPVPSAIQSGVFYYHNLPATMSADDDTPDIPDAYHDLIVAGASYRVAEQLNNIDLYNHYFSISQVLMADMANDIATRQSDPRPQVVQSQDILDA